jgi:hypothetical protein
MRRTVWLCLFLALVSASLIAEKEKVNEFVAKSFTWGDQKVDYQVKIYKPPIAISREWTTLDQADAVNASFLFFTHLANGDLEKASLLSNNPAKTRAKYERFQAMRGKKSFQKMYADYFINKSFIRQHFIVGKHHMLVMEVPDFENPKQRDLIAQFFEEKEGTYWFAEAQNDAIEDLSVLFRAVKENKLK